MSIVGINQLLMSLTLVATPMGNIDDISTRAKSALEKCEILILEEFKEGSSLIKALGLPRKEMYQLNEHSEEEDLRELLALCKEKDCALISDCGTPNFCDPGAKLVQLCREENIDVKSLPGPSSLMHILSLSSERLEEFYFRGFLPAKTELRNKALEQLRSEKRPFIIMDTPYRLKKTIDDLAGILPKRKALLGINLTQESEEVIEMPLAQMAGLMDKKKAEFVILVYSL